MTNEVKGKADKLKTTVTFDQENSELVAVLHLWVPGITPAELRQLFEFQRSGALTFSIASAQPGLPGFGEAAPSQAPGLPSVAGADKTPDYPTTEE